MKMNGSAMTVLLLDQGSGCRETRETGEMLGVEV